MEIPRFSARVVEGATARQGDMIRFIGTGGTFTFEAEDRATAYIKLYGHLTQKGNEVTVLDVQVPSLELTQSELEVIAAAGVPINPGTPDAGFQTEQIVQMETE